jgi:hypothetical protein
VDFHQELLLQLLYLKLFNEKFRASYQKTRGAAKVAASAAAFTNI